MTNTNVDKYEETLIKQIDQAKRFIRTNAKSGLIAQDTLTLIDGELVGFEYALNLYKLYKREELVWMIQLYLELREE